MRVHTPRSICDFGIAKTTITPPIGIYHRMWGAASHDQSEGVHRDLTATALVFRESEQGNSASTLQIVIAIDHCLFAAPEVENIINKAAHDNGVPVESIAVTFSHTHAAGLLNLDRVDLPGGEFIADYLDGLNSTVSQLVADAIRSIKPVAIEYAYGRCSLAAHRDLFDEQNKLWVCGYNPEGTSDETVLVARISDNQNQIIATCVNYACHPTTLAWDNRMISPDYPGAMCEVVENATNAPCVFLLGASGDLGPVRGFVGDTEIADRNGRQLGYAAVSALESLPPPRTVFEYDRPVVSGATIGVWRDVEIGDDQFAAAKQWSVDRETISLDYRDDMPKLADAEAELSRLEAEENAARTSGDHAKASDLRALAERQKRMIGRLRCLPAGGSYPFDVVLWRVGDAIWTAIPGEPYNLLQRELRARFPNTPIINTTIKNGWGPSYLPTAGSYEKNIYQESIAVLRQGSLETLIEQLTSKIERLGVS